MDTEPVGGSHPAFNGAAPGNAVFHTAVFHNNCVRDLAWAIFSPPLTSRIDTAGGPVMAPAFELTPVRQRWLDALDAQPVPLLNFLTSCQSRFLGVYFEALWHFFLLHDAEVTLLHCNRQIVDGGRTIGEFDVFYRCHRRNVTVHLELAVKFYMGMPVHGDGDLRQPSFWLGPNCADRLDLKLNHLRTRQLPLIDHPLAREWLTRHQLRPDVQEVALRGYLYYPWHIGSATAASAPRCAYPQHLHSHWLRDDQIALLQEPPGRRYRIVPKMQWLCSHQVDPAAGNDLDTFAQQIRRQFRSPLMQPVLCEELGEATEAGGTQSVRRFFMAPQDWPALHWPRKNF